MADKDLYKSLHTQLLSEQVVEQIEMLILEGHLQLGERLPAERSLSERLGVSRTVVREAVKSLQEKGLVEVRPGVGTFVHDGMSKIMRESIERMVLIDPRHGLDNLLEVREILEPQIAALAAHKATESDIQKLEAAVQQMDDAMDDVETFIAADHDFHLVLAQATQNQLLVSLLDSIVDLLIQQRRQIFLESPDGPKHGQEHHKHILQAVSIRDRNLARTTMLEHLQQIRDDISLTGDKPDIES